MKKLVILFFAASMLGISVRGSAEGPVFNRKFDPIVIHATQLAPFLGHTISNIRVFKAVPGHHSKTSKRLAARALSFQPIPFQIDERDAKGDWIFNYDKHGKPVPMKRPSLAPQDELVFMAKDAGPQAAPGRLSIPGAAVMEIELTDPIDTAHAYVYLASYQDNPPPLSPVQYVRYDPNNDRVTAPLYVMAFSKKAPLSYDYFAVPKASGGEGINIFDGFKMRLDIKTSLVNIHRDEDDFKSRLVGYIQGPVRVIRRVANSMDIVFGIQSPSVLSDSMYYYDYFQFPTIVDIPIDLQRLYIVKKARLVTTTDFNHNALGMEFYNSNNPGGLRITGKMSPAQKDLDRAPYDWAVVAGPQGAWMNRVVMGKDVPFTKQLYFVDDISQPDPPENEPGQIGSTGYDFGNLMKAKKGTYTFTSYIYVPVGYRPGDEKPWLNIIDHPVTSVVYLNGQPVTPTSWMPEKR